VDQDWSELRKSLLVKCDYFNNINNTSVYFAASNKGSAGVILPFEVYPAFSR